MDFLRPINSPPVIITQDETVHFKAGFSDWHCKNKEILNLIITLISKPISDSDPTKRKRRFCYIRELQSELQKHMPDMQLQKNLIPGYLKMHEIVLKGTLTMNEFNAKYKAYQDRLEHCFSCTYRLKREVLLAPAVNSRYELLLSFTPDLKEIKQYGTHFEDLQYADIDSSDEDLSNYEFQYFSEEEMEFSPKIDYDVCEEETSVQAAPMELSELRNDFTASIAD